jgi:carbon storage regulator
LRYLAQAALLGQAIPSAGEKARVLVLTRKSNQSIMIGDDIEISVLAIMGEKVRIGIEAPRSVPVFRRSAGAAEVREPLAGQHRQRLEHHDRDNHGCDHDREGEKGEAEGSLLARALHAADAGTLSGLLAEPLSALDRLGRLLAEGLLELRQ